MAEEATPQEGMNPEPELEVEETNTELETEETPAEVETEPTVPKAQFDQVLARAKRAEADLKKSRPAQNITNQNSNGISQQDAEIIILKSQGTSDALVSELKVLAKVRGKSLMDTQSDPIFVAIKDKVQADEKAEKARLGASRGSGTKVKDKSINTPGLTDAEHKELWRKNNGN